LTFLRRAPTKRKESGPAIRITPIPLRPGGVDNATMVSTGDTWYCGRVLLGGLDVYQVVADFLLIIKRRALPSPTDSVERSASSARET
jgi:hypothetical protein